MSGQPALAGPIKQASTALTPPVVAAPPPCVPTAHPNLSADMKLIVLACLVAVAVARPQDLLSDSEQEAIRERDRNAQITSFENQQTQDGGTRHSFTADNGIERQEEITLKEVRVINDDGEEEFRLVPFYTGSFQFPNNDGTFTTRRYYTDETGLHIEADDLPQAPQAF